MGTFRVTIRGEGLGVRIEGVETRCGFYKNEFLWAKNATDAVEKARQSVLARLRRDESVNRLHLDGLRLDVDGFEAVGIIALLQRQGFVFYPLDGD